MQHFNSEVIRNYVSRENNQSDRDISFILGLNMCLQEKDSSTFNSEIDRMKETACFKFMRQETSEFPHILKHKQADSFNSMNRNTMDNETFINENSTRLSNPIQNGTFDNSRKYARKGILSENIMQRRIAINPINMKYKERIYKQNEQIKYRSNMNEMNIERNKLREYGMNKEDTKHSYVNISHQRHHSDITAMYNSNATANMARLEPRSEKVSIKFGINNLQRKFLSSQKKIIREVFSPPVKNKKKRQQPSYDEATNYGGASDSTNISTDARNYTPNVIALKSFDNSSNRNMTTDGTSDRSTYFNCRGSFTNSNCIQKPISHQYLNNSIVKVPNHTRFVYITPYQYNKQHRFEREGKNVFFKIPSQKVLIENTGFSLE